MDGDVTISGSCTLNGGLIADSVDIPKNAVLTQIKTGDRNVIIAKVDDVRVGGQLAVQEAVVFAARDILTYEQWGPVVNITGSMIAMRDVNMWNVRTHLYYVHKYIVPPDMTDESSGISVVGWND